MRARGVVYDLDVRAYNLLRLETVYRPCYLVLLVLPEDESRWLTQSVDELVLRRCAYGISLRGASVTSNVQTIRITIPQSDVFSPQLVQRWMDEAGQGNGT